MNDWLRLKSTKELIKAIKNDNNLTYSEEIDI